MDASDAGPDLSPDLEEAGSDEAGGSSGKLRMLESDTPHCQDQHICERSEPEPQLLGPHDGGRGAVGQKIELIPTVGFSDSLGFHESRMV